MHAPDFWWRRERSMAATMLSPLGALVGAATLLRMRQIGTEPGIPVICIGNPTVGGAGKTPAAIYLAKRLIGQGHRPAILTRGYGGSERGPLLVQPARHSPVEVGDEPLLLARAAPTYVARDRMAGAIMAAATGADVLLMDDGFQNPALHKALSILVIDGGVGVGNGLCLPAGPLRAPLIPQFERAQAVLIVGEGAPGERVANAAYGAGLIVLRGRLAPDAQTVARLFGRRVLAYAGIGRPAKFFDMLRGLGVQPVEARAFPDHHVFTVSDAVDLQMSAQAQGLMLVTTEKDAARLAGSEAGQALLEASEVLPVRMALEPQSVKALDRLVAIALADDD